MSLPPEHGALLESVDQRIAHCKERVEERVAGHLEAIHTDIAALRSRVEEHVNAEETFWEDVRGAFAGTPDTHREWHEAVMRREARREALQAAVIEKTLAGLVWAAFIGLGTAVWHNFKDHLTR